jgi:uncharacterized protein YjiS (DUF1127 family)
MSLEAQRAALRQTIEEAERAMLRVGLTDLPVFNAAWGRRRRALEELERLRDVDPTLADISARPSLRPALKGRA